MSKKIIIAIALGLAIGIGIFFVFQNRSVAPTKEYTITTEDQLAAMESTQSYTAADVAMHSEKNSCWTIINGDVYDITTYIPRHPGGDDVLLACGRDGTTLFTGRVTPEGKPIGSGEPHSASAKEALAVYKIGSVSE